ncbi:MAG: putative 2-deoxy-D-gluconate 3-dehydrogenase [Microvirga sp.]|nr:putative 2-deoxy-D-gluconate 3-dehydrogenase [Microvirga sp.]
MKVFDLSGRVAIVTGGNGGIGLGIAQGLAKAGAKVTIAGRDAAKSESAAAELNRAGYEADFVVADLRKSEDCGRIIDETHRRRGRIDILVNNAGVSVRKAPQDYTLEEWHQVMDTNLTAAFLMSKACYPHFKAQGGGKIINIGSLMSLFGSHFAAAYGASKGGILQLTKSLCCAWGNDNIQVNAILPGWINTDLSRSARQKFPDLSDRVLARTPAGRWGEPEDFEGVAVFLASSASNFVSGASISLDGGYASMG